ncbi:MAG: hemerythrin domain-containing protein [Deltaproteobacteria bacterium]|nr:hemerythrin domain-containing protein [Deltaproteobacteria bacterium]
MSPLIEKLSAQHRELVALLNAVTERGVSSPEGRKLLLSARDALLAHLALEDKEMYPALAAAARTRPALRSTLDQFAADMDVVSAMAVEFFQRFGDDARPVDSFQFAREQGKFMAALRARIRKEEVVLYPEYETLGRVPSKP